MNRIQRAPAELKLGVCLAFLGGVAALPAQYGLWALVLLPVLLLVVILARLALATVLRRWAFGLPFLLAAASLFLFQPHGPWLALAASCKAGVCLLALQLLGSTTPLSELLRCLRRMRLPAPLCDTLALLARYSSLLAEEARRMRRARAGRTLRASRWQLWRALAESIGLLFVRAVSRAERVQIAMRSRGGV